MSRRLRNTLIVLVVVGLLWLLAPFSIREMASDSMAPLIQGQGSPQSRKGDYVLICTSLRLVNLDVGDLVLIELPENPFGEGETIRRIKSKTEGSPIRYEVEAMSEKGIDSRQFGLLENADIKGKVLHVFK